jgi:hypothetical protein
MKQLDMWTRAAPKTAVAVEPDRRPTADELAAWLAARLGRAVRLVLTNNRSTLLSYREDGGVIHLRLHRFFLNAGTRELEAMARFLSDDDREAGAVVDAFIEDQLEQVRVAPRKLRGKGRFHDLDEILTELNARFFHDKCEVAITWGHAGTRRYRRSIQLGSYSSHERLIRVHPSLDQAFVPRAYVAWVVFHEMLHEVLGVERGRVRRKLHPPEFSALEESYPGYAECKQWEQENLHRLLSFRPDGPRRRKPRVRR